VWALFHLRKKNLIAFGILYYFITFSIVSNIFFPIGTNMAERFMFMPSLGFCLIVVYLLYLLGVKWSKPNEINGFKTIYKFVGLLVLIFSGLTINRNFDWKDNFTLFTQDILVSKNSGKIHTDLAGEMINKAINLKTEKEKEIEDWTLDAKNAALKENEQERIDMVQNAIPLLNKALEIHPMSNTAWLQMANGQHFLGQIEGNTSNVNLNYLNTAIAAYDQALFYKTEGMDTTINKFKAICLMDLGKLIGQKFRDIPNAIATLEKAKALNPKNAEIFLLLGTAYSMINDHQKTIENCLQSVTLRPDDRDTKQNLAVAYQQYAFANATKRNLLPMAEKILLTVYNDEKKLEDNDVTKKDAMLRTLDLIYKNYTIQGKTDKANEYKAEVLKLNPKAYNN
jgi:protein O-mannosyl-transferase